MPKLTEQQRLFCERYVECGVATEAFLAAGYSAKQKRSAIHQNAAKLLTRPHVAAHIAELQAAARDRHRITVDRIVEEMAHIAFARFDTFHSIDPNTGLPQLDLRRIINDPRQFAAIAGVKVKTYPERGPDGEFEEVKEVEIKFGDKLAALEKLGKHLGMFKDTVVHEGEIAIKAAASEFDQAFTSFTSAVNSAAASALH